MLVKGAPLRRRSISCVSNSHASAFAAAAAADTHSSVSDVARLEVKDREVFPLLPLVECKRRDDVGGGVMEALSRMASGGQTATFSRGSLAAAADSATCAMDTPSGRIKAASGPVELGQLLYTRTRRIGADRRTCKMTPFAVSLPACGILEFVPGTS